MKRDNLVARKSYAFALRVVKAGEYLIRKKSEYVLSRQLVKSGTSIGANIEEALGAHSRADFLAKLTISYREARETGYWIRLLRDTGILPRQSTDTLLRDVEELMRLIGTIQVSTKRNSRNLP